MVKGDGSVLYPSYEVKILGADLKEKKSYKKEDSFIAEAEVTTNSIRLQRVKKTEKDGYEEIADDYILNSMEEKRQPVTMDKRITEMMFAEYYIDLPDAFEMEEIPVPEEVPYTLLSEDTTVRITELEKEAEEYMVYSFGEIVAVSDNCAEAIRLADRAEIVGTVTNEEGRIIWERGIKYASAALAERPGQSTKISELTSRQEAVRMMAAYLDREVDVTGLANEDTIKEFLQRTTGNRMLALSGVTLDEALYFVFRGAPVYAMKNQTEAVVITGYTANNITIYDPSAGKYKTVSLKEAERMFEVAGNIFLSYIR